MTERKNTVVCTFELDSPRISAYEIHEWIRGSLHIGRKTIPWLTRHLQLWRKWLPGLPPSWSPTLFSEVPPVTWTEKTIESGSIYWTQDTLVSTLASWGLIPGKDRCFSILLLRGCLRWTSVPVVYYLPTVKKLQCEVDHSCWSCAYILECLDLICTPQYTYLALENDKYEDNF
jgi:hypothetical protein